MKIAIVVIVGALCALVGVVFYTAATAPKAWQRPRLIVCPVRDPAENLDELRLACRKSLNLPLSGPDSKQNKSIWVEQSGAELTCVLDCAAQIKKDRAKSQY